MSYEFNYGVCRISRLVTEQPINVLPEAGFPTYKAARKYAVSANDGWNYTYVFLNNKPALLIGLDGTLTEYFKG